MKSAFWLAGAAAPVPASFAMSLAMILAMSPAIAGDTIKIGFVSTFSGPTACGVWSFCQEVENT